MRSLSIFVLSLLLAGCARQSDLHLPQPLRPPATDQRVAGALTHDRAGPGPRPRFEAAPPVPPLRASPAVSSGESRPPVRYGVPSGEKLTLNIESLALPAFINAVYGDLLKVPFQLAPAIQERKELVTLRISEPLPPAELDHFVRVVLSDYRVAVENRGGLWYFHPARAGEDKPFPRLVIGRALPRAPAAGRPVFFVIPLKAVRNTRVAGWMRQAFGRKDLTIHEDSFRNAIILVGPPALVREAAEAVRLLDQPHMRGRHGLRVNPTFWPVDKLAKRLEAILRAEGYEPGAAVLLLPIQEINTLLVFCADPRTLGHVKHWIGELDRRAQTPFQEGLFLYPVRNTSARHLAETLNPLLGKLVADGKGKKPGGRSLVIDPNRNALIFNGKAEEWDRLKPVMEMLDQPSPLVLIEVTIAEITLDDQQQLGVEWQLKNLDLGALSAVVGTGGLGLGSGGFSGILSSKDVQVTLNAFASSNRVTILSTPRVMVKNGEEASIDVGTDVPVITTQSTAPDLQQNGTASILQNIEYRKTGVLLRVKPVVYAGNRIDLEISQEVSEAQPNTTSSVSSPLILNRSLKTLLSLEDGEAVLLGGLISSNQNRGRTGVPWFMNVPFLGQLFRNDKATANRTELILLITPYVIHNGEEARGVTRAFRERLFDTSDEKPKNLLRP